MKNKSPKLAVFAVIGLLFLFFQLVANAAVTLSPVGYWQTIDDRTHEPAGVISIWENQGQLYGTIVKIYPRDGDKPTDICKNCGGTFHNKPILGMTVIWGLVQKQDGSWAGGKIMDPKIGKIYDCKFKLSDDGQHLAVRGYLGISLLGRTQTWNRLNHFVEK